MANWSNDGPHFPEKEAKSGIPLRGRLQTTITCEADSRWRRALNKLIDSVKEVKNVMPL